MHGETEISWLMFLMVFLCLYVNAVGNTGFLFCLNCHLSLLLVCHASSCQVKGLYLRDKWTDRDQQVVGVG